MRQLIVQVPRGLGREVVSNARDQDGKNLAFVEATAENGACDIVFVHVPNGRVDPLVSDLQRLPDLRITLVPRGVIALYPPAEAAPEQVIDVGSLSPIEIFLSGLQSVGSWTAFLGYAAAAGVVVWIGLFTNTVFLLTAAMLIAPFAGPAMSAALATARGDAALFGRSLLRYVAALAVSIAVAFALSIAMGQEIATPQMVDTSFVPSVAVLLPLVAGAAGALNLCQSERNSLVSGAATGMLVAASLAPPAGLIGMTAAIGEWDMVKSGAFVLMLQLVGINLSGAAVFRMFGLSPKGARYERGRPGTGFAIAAASAAGIAALLAWQFASAPALQRSTEAQRAAAEVKRTIRDSGEALPVEVNARFTRADIPGQNTLLIEAYAQATGDRDRDEVARELAEAIRRRVSAAHKVEPLIDLTVFRR